MPRSPAARVGLPRTVAKPVKEKDTVAWTEHQVDRFLAATANHRWAIAFRLGVLYGLRRSEVLALRWDDLDSDQRTLRIDESLVATNEGAAWGNAKNERSRRTMCRHPCVDEQLDRCRPPAAWDHLSVSCASGMGPPERQ
jgi:integrase